MKGVIVALQDERKFLDRLEEAHGAFSRLLRRLPPGGWGLISNSGMLARAASEPCEAVFPVRRLDIHMDHQLVPTALVAASWFLPPELRRRRLVLVDASFPLVRVPDLPDEDTVSVEAARLHPIHALRRVEGDVIDWFTPPAEWAGKIHGRDMLPPAFEVNGAVTLFAPDRVDDFEGDLRAGRVSGYAMPQVETFNARTELGYCCLHEILENGWHEQWASGRVGLVEFDAVDTVGVLRSRSDP
jgi:hypothetical protein